MGQPSDRFLRVLRLRPRPAFTSPSWLLPLASSRLVRSATAADPESDGPRRPDEAALIGIFKGTVEVTASDAKIDGAKRLDRVLASGAVDHVQYADHGRCSE
ncbi:MAG: hypothetical protein CMJ27_09435 [Phycisphaerae bacterium]|nr:hypothetical protein [Phycisphaerae bacterium]OUX00957.1 MAG: hypothetical protein CBD91_05625 [Phycisphaeraceae bacterium TMED231]